MTILEEIKLLCSELPEKDQKIALNLIDRRDFESLEELVLSVSIYIERNNTKVDSKTDLKKLDELKIRKLHYLISRYINV